VLAGPAAYAVQTAGTAHTGAIPTAGPAVASSFGPGGGRGGMPGGFRPGGFTGQAPAGGFAGQQGQLGRQGFGGVGGRGGAGGMGGLLDAATPSSQLVALLQEGASSYTWAAATTGANNAAGYQLASGEAVMPVGGFNGSDPSPTLAQFQQDVAQGRIHYFIGGSSGGGGFGGGGFGGGAAPGSSGGSRSASEISAWVQSSFTAQTVGGVTVYDLTAGTSGAA